MKVIYVSGPYSAPTPKEVMGNVHNAARVAAECMVHGWSVLCPHCNSHCVARYIEQSHADWVLMDLALLEKSDAVLMMRGWEKSKGARTEHSYALSKNIKVFYEADGIPSSLS
jgi:hypothetical protein